MSITSLEMSCKPSGLQEYNIPVDSDVPEDSGWPACCLCHIQDLGSDALLNHLQN